MRESIPFYMDNKNHPLMKIYAILKNSIAIELSLSDPVDKVGSVEHYVESVPATIAYNDDGRSVRIFPKQLYRFYLYFPLDIFYRLNITELMEQCRFEFSLRNLTLSSCMNQPSRFDKLHKLHLLHPIPIPEKHSFSSF